MSTIKTARTLAQFDLLPNTAGVREPVACALLGCSPVTVWRMARAGNLQTVRVGPRVTLFSVGSIRAVLRGNPDAQSEHRPSNLK